MFRASRRKIVASIMVILLVLYLGTLSIIYASSYYEVSNRNKEMLEQFVMMYPLERQEPDNMPGSKPPLGKPHLQDSPEFKLAVFYSVEISYEGGIIKINNALNGVFSDDEIEKTALNVYDSGKSEGVSENLIFKTADKGGYILIGFMDNTIMQESMTTLFRYTLIFGGIAVICFFILAVYLAKRIVTPLEESYKKQRQFISDAGHELKTPISVVNANAELLSRELGENNQWLENIKYENGRMGTLVGQLLELARTENVSVPKELIDFSHLAEGEILPFEGVAFEKGLTFNCAIKNDLHVIGNEIQLKQLVSILIDNAVSHSEKGGEISVTLKREKNLIKLSVINDGREIPPEKKSELFERFYRTDSARNSESKHYGLGLAIAKAIVSAHLGQIDVISKNGKVNFTVSLPLKK